MSCIILVASGHIGLWSMCLCFLNNYVPNRYVLSECIRFCIRWWNLYNDSIVYRKYIVGWQIISCLKIFAMKRFNRIFEIFRNKYRSVQELRSSSKLFRYFWFQALYIEFIVEKVWFGLVSIDGLNKQTK